MLISQNTFGKISLVKVHNISKNIFPLKNVSVTLYLLQNIISPTQNIEKNIRS